MTPDANSRFLYERYPRIQTHRFGPNQLTDLVSDCSPIVTMSSLDGGLGRWRPSTCFVFREICMESSEFRRKHLLES